MLLSNRIACFAVNSNCTAVNRTMPDALSFCLRKVVDDHGSRHAGIWFLSRVSTLTCDIDIANLSVCPSVRDVAVSNENGLTHRHSFFTIW